MAKTLAQIQKEIDRLQEQARSIREKEVGEVIGRIQEAIRHYGLTPADLFGVPRKRAAGKKAARKSNGGSRAKPARPASPIKYRDEQGHTWTGRGKRPGWFKQALAEGRTAESMLVSATPR
ncbi:MAG: hypothetical protein RI988_799 [Pseudomonadota bacterium]